MSHMTQQLNDNMAAVVECARRALVQVSNGQRSFGAGTIWHPDGLIITNAHVVAGHHGLNVSLPDGQKLPAQVLAEDRNNDLAALAVDAKNLPTIELGKSTALRPGEWVMAVGHPWGVMGAVTGGVVIGLANGLPEMPGARNEWIAVDMHMRPGHSGGPLVNVEGQLVGINTMITGPDVGYAIPVHVVKRFLKRALDAEKTSRGDVYWMT